MTRRATGDAIRLRGVRHNNLKNFDLDIPIGKLTVITGLSGSGKSSLAFDTLFAEGQRRYIETFSPYARQFFDRLDKPQVDRIEGIPPAIAIEQRNAVRSTRSTVGTMTEICDYLKVLWPHLARLHCRQCQRVVRPEPPQVVWERVMEEDRGATHPGDECLVTFDLPLSEKLSLAESLELIARQGYQRLLVADRIVRVDEAAALVGAEARQVTVIQDRLKITAAQRARFVEACEQAYHFGKGRLAIRRLERRAAGPSTATAAPAAPGESPPAIRSSHLFSRGHHCAECDIDYAEPSPALFSFNHPLGACPDCKGFGRIIRIDYQLALPDRSRTLAEGAVKPWQTGMSAECQVDLLKACKKRGVPVDVPFSELSADDQHWVIDGDAGYVTDDPANSWPAKWYGVRGYFRWLESKSYKMHVRVLLSRYRAYTTCEACQGQRLRPEAIRYRLEIPGSSPGATGGSATQGSGAVSLSLPEFYALSIERALELVERLSHIRPAKSQSNDPLTLALGEVRTRLGYLAEVGLGYITLDRPTRTLSGGETERVNLTTCLGTRLVNTLFVLDEPSVGLHPRDTARLVRILERLRDTGNTVVVVEHEAGVIRAADQIVDLGPGQGEKGGEIVFTGSLADLMRSRHSLTGQYLSGRRRIEALCRRPVAGQSGDWQLGEAIVPYNAAGPSSTGPDPANAGAAPAFLRISNATRHNLKNVTVEIPLRRFVALTGVSGSGKTTLVREILLPTLEARLAPRGSGSRSGKAPASKASDRIDSDAESSSTGESIDGEVMAGARVDGWEGLDSVVLVDQSALGKTPRSNPVVYIGAFDDIRDLFAQTDLARQRGLGSSSFSFNSGVGQCERCRGAGFEKIEMQFLSDVFIRCPECAGRRYRGHILEVKLRGPVLRGNGPGPKPSATGGEPAGADRTVADWSIADILEATVDSAIEFLGNYLHVPAGRRAVARLKLLQDVGLGYLRLGQPINTLSGGESQRLKLVSHLAESDLGRALPSPEESAGGLAARNTATEVRQWLSNRRKKTDTGAPPIGDAKPDPAPAVRLGTLFLFDEPTTGLHFEDTRVLLQVFQRIVNAGHSIVVIEHNLDVIQCADWVIDLGPEGGDAGGRVVVAGTPEDVADCEHSHTGRHLREQPGGGRGRASTLEPEARSKNTRTRRGFPTAAEPQPM